MNNTPTNNTSRVDQSIARWRAQEQRYVQQYGNNIYNDRDFMKVRAAAYKMINDQFKNQKLTFEEKLDLKVLQGQIKQMNERIYPNPYIRTTVGILKLLSRPVIAVGKLGANIVSYLVTGQPYFKNHKPAPKPATIKKLEPVPAAPNEQTKTNGERPEIQKRMNHQRVLTAEPNGQSIRR